ncbi:MAG: hypothetical protein GDA37_07640 [Ekhidna sp.]|nr:hypothetical protein [Ekhidna sp.]
MKQKEHHKVPEISIDEALKLYLSVAFPQGLPEGEEGERILKAIKEKIASERPDWAKASGWQNEADEEPRNYAEVKQAAIEEAAKEDIPEDPEERCLHLRRQEALENSRLKREKATETDRQAAFRKEVISKKNEDDRELVKRAALIKKVLLARVRQKKMTPEPSTNQVKPSEDPTFSKPRVKPSKESTTSHQQVSFSRSASVGMTDNFSSQLDPININDYERKDQKTDQKPDARDWFKDFKSLSMEDRLKSIQEFNQRKREMLKTKEELMWNSLNLPHKSEEMDIGDSDFNMDYGFTFQSDDDDFDNMKME